MSMACWMCGSASCAGMSTVECLLLAYIAVIFKLKICLCYLCRNMSLSAMKGCIHVWNVCIYASDVYGCVSMCLQVQYICFILARRSETWCQRTIVWINPTDFN